MSAPQIPGFSLEREIGAGGMARVYLATQSSLERKVALKVMAPALVADPAFSKRFLREARMLANLTHPNIVAVYDVGATDAHIHYFAMQFLDNGDFACRMRQGVAEPELVRVLSAIGKALGFAHSRGVIHRDISPGNILFDAAQNPVLTDFGIARSQHGSTRITHTGVSIGTSSYMSPEQARGGEVDPRSDLYSLGALCFEALTGHPPYQGSDGFAVAYAHVFEPIPRLPVAVAHWQLFIDKVLAKDPNDRFDSAEQFIVAMHDVPISATRIVPNRSAGKPQPATLVAQALPAPSAQKPAAPSIVPVANPAFSSASITPPRGTPVVLPVPLARAAAPPQLDFPANVGAPNRRAWLAWALIAGVLTSLAGASVWWWQHPSTGSSRTKFDPVSVRTEPPPVAATTTLPAEGALDPAGTAVELIDPTLASAEFPADRVVPPDALAGPLTRSEFVKPWLAAALASVKKNQCFVPEAEARKGVRSAIENYRLALTVDLSSAEAIKGIDTCFNGWVQTIAPALAKPETDLAALAVNFVDVNKAALSLGPKAPQLGVVAAQRKLVVEALLEKATALEQQWQGQQATTVYQQALGFQPASDAAKAGVARAAKIGIPGYAFQDALSSGGKAPLMVVIGAGKVTLRDARNSSVSVEIKENYAVGRHEVTVAEFRRFVSATGRAMAGSGCNNKEGFALFNRSKERTWKSPGFKQEDRSPVVCVTHNDAQDFARWMGAQTGEKYMLLSEAQWQQLAQAAAKPDCKSANLADLRFAKELEGGRDVLACDDGFAGTAPAGNFGRDRNGISDISGNVREWTADCANRSLALRPKNAQPWLAGDCTEHMALGTAWVSGPKTLQVLTRTSFDNDDRNNTVGFRIAREVPQVRTK